jgi:hypothetical protein
MGGNRRREGSSTRAAASLSADATARRLFNAIMAGTAGYVLEQIRGGDLAGVAMGAGVPPPRQRRLTW